jgi:hypothetical protein
LKTYEWPFKMERMPSDPEAAVAKLLQAFPGYTGICPAATVHQIYGIVRDKSSVDSMIQAQTALGHCRMMPINDFGYGLELALVRTQDYVAFLKGIVARMQQSFLRMPQPGDKKARPNSHSVAHSTLRATHIIPLEDKIRLLINFTRRVPYEHQNYRISLQELLDYCYSEDADKFQRITQQQVAVVLMQVGVLLATGSGERGYLVTVPNMGVIATEIPKARKQIKQWINAKKYKEIKLKELEKKKLSLNHFKLPLHWHIRDILGGELLRQIHTTNGTLLKLA